MKNLFPNWLYEKISNNYLLDYISEIRIRVGKPIVVCYKGRYDILQDRRAYELTNICADKDLISYILTVATKQSFYAYNNQIKKGFITTDNGIRIGLCGNVVIDDEKISTIKNISSLNIRVSHKVKGCSDKILDLICQNNIVKNTLIISPPGAGKTTLIRDIASSLSNCKYINNILLVDERYEIAGDGFSNDLSDGIFVDIISGAPKHYAFHEGIKAMNPSVIIADEISDMRDFEEILDASRCGVKIIVTAHAGNIEDLKRRSSFAKFISEKIFDRIIVLSKRLGLGTIETVYDENLKGIYIPVRQ